MKKGLLIILIISLLIPVASATISINGPSQSKYNVGEKIEISGYLLEEEDISGYMKLEVVCGEDSYPMQLTAVEVSDGEKIFFSNIDLPNIVTRTEMVGFCHVKASLLVSGVTVEDDSSSTFEVVQDMEGSFDVDGDVFQLGDTIELYGSLYTANGEEVDGTVEIYFELDGEEYLIDVIEVENSEFDYFYEMLAGFPGDYKVNIIARDSYGNYQEFTSVSSFELSNELYVTVDSSVDSLLPGEMLNVFGDVKSVHQETLTSASVVIGFEDELYSTTLIEGAYSASFKIPSDIKTGEYSLTVNVEDGFSNEGSNYKMVDVDAYASEVEVFLNNHTFYPSEEVEVTVRMYDQAGDFMTGDVTLQVYDTDEGLISEVEVGTEESILYEIPDYGEPGTWTFIVTLDELTDSESLEVLIYSDLKVVLDNGTLYITNIGNVDYTDEIELEVENENAEYTIKRSRDLSVGETIAIDLSEEVPSGSYSLRLPTGSSVTDVGDVEITDGTSRTSFTWLYILLVVAFMAGLSFVVFKRVKPRLKRRVKKPKKFINPKPGVKVKRKVAEKKKKKMKIDFDNREQSVADFKKRVMKEIVKTEAKGKRNDQQKKLATVLPPKKSLF
jgi:hypothetical protein